MAKVSWESTMSCKDKGSIKQHQMMARGKGLMKSSDFDVQSYQDMSLGKVHGDAMNNKMLMDHDRAKGKPVHYSKHHLPAERAPDHGKHHL